MLKILHTARYTGEPWRILRSVVPDGFCIETLNDLSYEQLLQQVVDADYLLVSGRLPIDEGVLSAAKKLKMIQRTGVGVEMLDKEAILRHGIPVFVNAGVNARSVAEHAFLLMLCCLKNVPAISARVKNGVWKKQQTGLSCNEMFGKIVGLVGMGAIGCLVAKYPEPFGARVLYTDIRRLSGGLERELNLEFVDSFEKLLPQVDLLSFHCPLTDANCGMLNRQTLSLMKTGAAVVNTARGKLIDEDALLDALRLGKVRSAALDVHCEEPLTDGSRFKAMDNVILTPHIAGLSHEAFTTMMDKAVENIVAYAGGRVCDGARRIL